MSNSRISSSLKFAVALALAASLAACGGGGGGGTNNAAPSNTGTAVTPVTPETNPPATTFTPSADGKLHAACSTCGTVDDSTYAGKGWGLWQALNKGDQDIAVNVALKGLSGQDVTMVFTNESTSDASLQPLTVSSSGASADSVAHQAVVKAVVGTMQQEDPHLTAIRAFNQTGWAKLAGTSAAPASAVLRSQLSAPLRSTASYNVGETRNFYYMDNTARTEQLMQTAKTSDGTVVNLWVESSELGTGKVTPDLINTLLQKYAGAGGVYDSVTSIGGKLYGPNTNAALIDGTSQPIDLVLMNFNHDGAAFGTIGYFSALNSFKQGAGDLAFSNESLSLYLDTETLYLDAFVGVNTGVQTLSTTMAHESTHMQNFYRRGLLMGAGYMYDTWLEEMSAMMMEDWVDFNLDNTFNMTRDNRITGYIVGGSFTGGYNCGLTNWQPLTTTCDSYSVNGSFGGFLNRQLGLDFFKELLNDKNKTDSLGILDDAIAQTRPGSSTAQELRHFTVTTLGLVWDLANMSEYSFRARSEAGFTLPSIDVLYRPLPATSPATLPSFSGFPVVRQKVTGNYQETVVVPKGSTLSVVVH